MNYASKEKTFSDHIQDMFLLIALVIFTGIMAYVCNHKPNPIPYRHYVLELSAQMTNVRKVSSQAEIDSVRNYYINLLGLGDQ